MQSFDGKLTFKTGKIRQLKKSAVIVMSNLCLSGAHRISATLSSEPWKGGESPSACQRPHFGRGYLQDRLSSHIGRLSHTRRCSSRSFSDLGCTTQGRRGRRVVKAYKAVSDENCPGYLHYLL